ncbi:MAG: hypothetical protein ACK4GQ_00455 [Candidatus Hadarchaeales archaeon]
MMKKIFVMFVVLLLLQPVGAESIKELLENSRTFDGKIVTITGEVIGVFKKENAGWINVFENGWAIGVLVSRAQAENITFVGDYRHLGDIVTVTGLFYMHCPYHGGGPDIHAENFMILSTGREIQRPPNPLTVFLSSLLLAATVYLAYYMKKLRKEKPLPIPFRI